MHQLVRTRKVNQQNSVLAGFVREVPVEHLCIIAHLELAYINLLSRLAASTEEFGIVTAVSLLV